MLATHAVSWTTLQLNPAAQELIPMTLSLLASAYQEAIGYYRTHRKEHPLPVGWTEKLVQTPDRPGADILLENDTYNCNLWFRQDGECDHHLGYYLDCYFLRKDRQLPSLEDTVAVTKQLFGNELTPEDNDTFVAAGYSPDGTIDVLWPCFTCQDNPHEHFGRSVYFTYPPDQPESPNVFAEITQIPGLVLDDDYMIVKVPTDRVEQLVAWLEEQSLPPLEEIETPQGDVCLSHSAQVLERFDHTHPYSSIEEQEDLLSRVIGDFAVATLLYRFPKGEDQYRTVEDLPAGAIFRPLPTE